MNFNVVNMFLIEGMSRECTLCSFCFIDSLEGSDMLQASNGVKQEGRGMQRCNARKNKERFRE